MHVPETPQEWQQIVTTLRGIRDTTRTDQGRWRAMNIAISLCLERGGLDPATQDVTDKSYR